MSMAPYVGDEGDEDEYNPSIAHTSSIVLLTVCCLSIATSLYVARSVHNIGTHTASSKLILYLTLTHANMNFAKTPFLFNQIPYGCHLSGILFFYSYLQIYLISYFMLACSYSLLLEDNSQSAVSPTDSRRMLTPRDYKLSFSSKCSIFVIPLLALVFPLTSNVFEEKFNWCGINPDSHFGFLVFVQYIVIFAIVSFLTIYELYKICWELRRYSVYSSELFSRFFKGPFLYAFVSFAIILGCSIFIFTRVNGDDMDRQEYYHQYMIIIGMYIPAFFYIVIFLVEKKYIKSIEEDYDEMNNFCREFCDDNSDTSCRMSTSYKSSVGTDGPQSSLISVLLDDELY